MKEGVNMLNLHTLAQGPHLAAPHTPIFSTPSFVSLLARELRWRRR